MNNGTSSDTGEDGCVCCQDLTKLVKSPCFQTKPIFCLDMPDVTISHLIFI